MSKIERLTAHIGDWKNDVIFSGPEGVKGVFDIHGLGKHGMTERLNAIANRLAAYEDTGLMPTQCRELLEEGIMKDVRIHNLELQLAGAIEDAGRDSQCATCAHYDEDANQCDNGKVGCSWRWRGHRDFTNLMVPETEMSSQ